MTPLDQAKREAEERVTLTAIWRIEQGAEIAVTGGTCVVPLDLESRTDWDVLDRRAASMTYPLTIEAADGSFHELADATAAHAAADQILGTVMEHRAAALETRKAIRAATNEAEVDAALAAYLGAS